MKLGQEFYPLQSLRSNPKYGIFLKKKETSKLVSIRADIHTPFKRPIICRS